MIRVVFIRAACCDMRMMDSTNQVVIDTETPLTPGRYRALSARFCTTEMVYIQIWTRLSDGTYELKLNVARTAADRENAAVMVTVNGQFFSLYVSVMSLLLSLLVESQVPVFKLVRIGHGNVRSRDWKKKALYIQFNDYFHQLIEEGHEYIEKRVRKAMKIHVVYRD